MTKVQILTDIPETGNILGGWYLLASEEHIWCRWRFDVFMRLISRLGISKTDNIKGLDIGCGNGLVRRQLEKTTDWIVDGTDLDRRVLEDSNPENGTTMLYDIHQRNEELREAYDFIILFDVLEHIEDTSHFLDSVLFHLKPGGHLHINVPAREEFRTRYDDAVGHIRRYSKSSLKNEFTNKPAEVLRVQYWGFLMIPLLLIRKAMLASSNLSHDEIVEKGFSSRGKFVDSFVAGLKFIELNIFRRSPLGSSVIATIQKN